jgi:hypothetical protein
LVRRELRTASGLWGQCGVHFGLEEEQDIQIVDPPPPFLMAVGCDLGLPTSGGALRFRLGDKRFQIETEAGLAPSQVAQRVAAAVEGAGYRATVSPNARTAQGALPTVDVLMRDRRGKPIGIAVDGGAPLSSDPTLGVCVGAVDFTDGLTHFTDYDAVSGTVEERAMLKAFDDGDPTTIELYVVSNFARSGRIGESFLYVPGASAGNAVVLDRAGVRAGARSYTLAHELGHILLNMPGHPDDFGVDKPSSLMDADASDPTIFGPRRLSLAECERAIVQSGPETAVPLLESWPLFVAPDPPSRRAASRPGTPSPSAAQSE